MLTNYELEEIAKFIAKTWYGFAVLIRNIVEQADEEGRDCDEAVDKILTRVSELIHKHIDEETGGVKTDIFNSDTFVHLLDTTMEAVEAENRFEKKVYMDAVEEQIRNILIEKF